MMKIKLDIPVLDTIDMSSTEDNKMAQVFTDINRASGTIGDCVGDKFSHCGISVLDDRKRDTFEILLNSENGIVRIVFPDEMRKERQEVETAIAKCVVDYLEKWSRVHWEKMFSSSK